MPDLFINKLMQEMSGFDLKCMLVVFQMIKEKKGNVRGVAISELATNRAMLDCVKDSEGSINEALLRFLGAAVRRQLLIGVEVLSGEKKDTRVFLNTPAGKEMASRVLDEGQNTTASNHLAPARNLVRQEDIFTLYEENIGLITPLIAELLVDAINEFPEDWIREAIAEAVSENKRNWRYIEAILKRWGREGKANGKHRQGTSKEGPERFIGETYGHLIRR